MLEQLSILPDLVPGLRNWSIGRHVGDGPHTSDGLRFDYALTCDFDDFDDLQSYQDHPSHQAVVERVLPLYAGWAVVDLDISSFPATRA